MDSADANKSCARVNSNLIYCILLAILLLQSSDARVRQFHFDKKAGCVRQSNCAEQIATHPSNVC